MTGGKITRYVETGRVTAHAETGALRPKPIHKHWDNLVSQRVVSGIAITPGARQLWVATRGGVLFWNREKSLRYIRYGSEHGLLGNDAACICVDHAERPWTGHADGGLSYFEGGQWHVYEHIQDQAIRVICPMQGTDGIWAAGSEAVYGIADPRRNADPAVLAHDAAAAARALLDEPDGLLLGNAWGLFRVKRGHAPSPVLPDKITNCVSLTRDGQGGVWVSTSELVYRLEGEELVGPFGPAQSAMPVRIVALAAGRKRCWVLTTEGIAHITDNQWFSVPWPASLPRVPMLSTIAASHDDSYLWFGWNHLVGGVSVAGQDTPIWDIPLLSESREDTISNLGRAVTHQADGEHIWIGTADGLLSLGVNPDDWTHMADIGDVRAVAATGSSASSSGDLWLLTWPDGALRLIGCKTLDRSWPQAPGIPCLLALGNDAQPHVVSDGILWRLTAQRPERLSSNAPAMVTGLAQTPDGAWWLGTTQGVYRLDTGNWSLAGELPGPQAAEVFALAVCRGSLWAGTESGLWQRLATGWELHGENGERVHAIAESGDKRSLWLALADGIARYDPAQHQLGQLHTPANSGLASRRVAALIEGLNCLWVVTLAGVSRLTLTE